MSPSQFPFVYNDGQQDLASGVLLLAPDTTWPSFQQQLLASLGLPAASMQVMLACSRASDREQVQKIPVHEGTNFAVLLTRHNPTTDSNAHFIVQPKMGVKLNHMQSQPQRKAAETHEDEVVSRASSASSSPRYSTALMAQVVAARAANSGFQPGSLGSSGLTGGGLQGYLLAHQQRQAVNMGAGSYATGHLAMAAAGNAFNGVPPSGLTGAAHVSAPRPPRNVPLAPHGNGWTQQGLQTQQHLHKHAVSGAARLRQSSSPAVLLQQPLPVQAAPLPQISVGIENRIPAGLVSQLPAPVCAPSQPWAVPSSAVSCCVSAVAPAPLMPFAPATPPALGGPPRVPSFPAGVLSAAHSRHGGGADADFWRTSPRDCVVEGFKGPSPFGPIGPLEQA